MIWHSWRAKGQRNAGHPHMEWGRQMGFISHFYFYLWTPSGAGRSGKTNAYAPFPVWVWLNGHEWAKRQLAKAGVGFTALDNGFRSCEDPVLLQRVCDRLGPGAAAGVGTVADREHRNASGWLSGLAESTAGKYRNVPGPGRLRVDAEGR